MSSDYTALLSLHASLPIDYPDGADISIKCQPRGWLYAIVVISTLVLVILSITLLVVITRVVVKKRKKISTYYPIRSLDEPTDTTAGISGASGHSSGNHNEMKSEAAPSDMRPPPYNPGYSGHGYGSTLDNGDRPPPYSEI